MPETPKDWPVSEGKPDANLGPDQQDNTTEERVEEQQKTTTERVDAQRVSKDDITKPQP